LPGLTRQSMMTRGDESLTVKFAIVAPHHGCPGQALA
jgi:hypothetical protein